MSYLFENLNDENFQQLCQALLVGEYPNIQCIPVNQPDGGRDAFVYIKSDEHPKKSFIVFQVKFSVNPANKDSREAVKNLIVGEKEKIQRLASRGAVKYILMTNIGGTSHLDSGSIDLANNELSTISGIECQCWWRDDISRRIDKNPQIKWSFPNIIRASDLLQILIYNENSNKINEERVNTIKAYMSYQYSKDSQLKFKQIELQKNISDLFVDVPVDVQIPEDEKLRARWTKDIGTELRNILINTQNAPYGWATLEGLRGQSEPPGAAFLLANKAFARHFSKLVIEGAPGQGKSTVTQYLCQIHRMMLLSRSYDISKIPDDHKPTEVRIPFRVDLRDYASWLVGRDPFSDDPEARLPADTNPILESYIAAQIRRYTGQLFSATDLASISISSQILIVLDGFDEVADVPLRNKLVVEISDAAIRLEATAISIQIIVTSRPAAFANSPGFARSDWQHVQLLSLSKDVIETYTKKWLDGRNADERERRDITGVLREKIQQAHVRDLSRNPMQLAILLTLVSIQGASLPDKRTALYDKYIDVFFNREAEKSQVVRDHRELLIQIQRYIAYKLQAAAETDGRSGSISENALKETIREYLNSLNSRKNIVDDLFAGLKERVGALVSRVQGTYEFEVQPLREYFAARYLYDTAPYSPTGSQRRGALPDRFEAIGCNAYWLNVTRFYAGCYSSGELASLVEGIETLSSRGELRFTSHIIHLPVILLTDYIFDHKIRLSIKVTNMVTSEPNLTLLLAQQSSPVAGRELTLPPDSGQPEIALACRTRLQNLRYHEDAMTVSRVLGANSNPHDCKSFWLSQDISYIGFETWISIGGVLGVYDELDIRERADLVTKYGIDIKIELYNYDRPEIIDEERVILKEIATRFISGIKWTPFYYRRSASNQDAVEILSLLNFLLSSRYFVEMKAMPSDATFNDVYYRYIPIFDQTSSVNVEISSKTTDDIVPVTASEAIKKFFKLPVSEISSSIEHWDDLISELCKAWGDTWALFKLAISVAPIVGYIDNTDEYSDLSDNNISICARISFAKISGNDNLWWENQLRKAEICDDLHKIIVIRCLIEFASLDTIFLNCAAAGRMCDEIDENAWIALSDSVPLHDETRRQSRRRVVRTRSLLMPEQISPRLASLLVKRFNARTSTAIFDKYISNYDGPDKKIIEVLNRKIINKCIEDPSRWPNALSYISSSYKLGVADRIFARHRKRDVDLPIETAIDICHQADQYPFGLVAQAERVIANHFGGTVEAVGRVAERENWDFEA